MLRTCPECDTTLSLHRQHDAYFCIKCNEWREPPCGNKACGFCAGRPEKPL